jgi:predicted ABC-type ATPase
MNYAQIHEEDNEDVTSKCNSSMIRFGFILGVTILLLAVLAIPSTYLIIYIRVRDSAKRTTCYKMCKASTEALDCWCMIDGKPSLHRESNFCTGRVRYHSELCLLMDTDGCPSSLLKPNVGHCPLDNSSSIVTVAGNSCIKDPILYQYLTGKYQISGLVNDNYLINSSRALLFGEQNDFVTMTRTFVESLKFVDSQIGNDTVQFQSEFEEESAVSQAYYFSFFWKNPPMFKGVLPDNDTRLTPSYLINTPERNAWRTSVVEQILSTGVPVVGRSPKFYFISGGAGSGKTTIVKLLTNQGILNQNQTVYINSDDIKVMDPIYINLTSIGEFRAAEVVHKDSSNLASIVLERAINSGYDIILDAVMGSLDKAQLTLNVLNAKNYEIYLIGVTVDCDIAIQRASSRAMKSIRYVKADTIIEGHQKFSKYFPIYAHIISTVLLFDNNGNSPILIAEKKPEDSLLRILVDPLYSSFSDKIYLNMNAEDLFELYTNYCVELDRIKQTLKASCAVTKAYTERYMRVYLMISTYNMKHEAKNVCLCASQKKLVGVSSVQEQQLQQQEHEDTLVNTILNAKLFKEILKSEYI